MDNWRAVMLYVFSLLMIVGGLVGFLASAAGVLGLIPPLESGMTAGAALALGFIAACAMDVLDRRA